ncbi:MAG TPA: HEAT repeat domain-containing protein [Pyrinomonadaceae bacterium]|nr:HEAT repeat domain-containing protein [Pyrinomonadaceae bacterium]
MRTKLLVVLAAALALSAMLLAGGASAQRQGNANASGGAKSKRVVGVRSSDTGSGSRVTITADDTLKDYSAYRSGDRFYVVLPKAAAGARGGGSGKGYSDMQVQQRGDSVVLSYRVQPGAKPRVEQKFNRLDVVFDVPGGGAQQAATSDAARAQQQQQQQQTPPAENRDRAAQQNNQTATSTPNAVPTPERRQPTAEEAARAQAASAASANATATEQPAPAVDPAAQNPATASVGPTQEPSPAATPATEIAQAQQPAPVAPITASQPRAGTQTGSSLGTFLIRNWALALVFALIVVGLGLIFAARRTAAARPAPVESLDDSKTKLEEPRASRAKEETARALKDASATAQASALDAAKPAAAGTPEPVGAAEAVSKSETAGASEMASDVSAEDVNPLAAATALAGGAAAAKSRKQSRKDARQESKRKKKKGAGAEEPIVAETPADESTVAAPVAQEPAVEEPVVEEQVVAAPVAEETAAVEPVADEVPVQEETVETPSVEQAVVTEEAAFEESAAVEAPAVEEVVQEEPAEVAQDVTAGEAAEVVAESEATEHFVAPAVETAEPERLEAAEPSVETTAPALLTSEAVTREVAPVETETAEPPVAEAEVEAPAPVTEIEPAFAPEPERVLSETQSLLGGSQYDRAVIGSRDAMTRQMVAAELLSALAGRNAQRRELARAAFVEHGYYEETARDLREADAPAERSAAARSLAILGDSKATPPLVAALEDPVSDVRRAAVEALGALRDPSAVGPLEALLERERTERYRIPPRIIRTAIEFCREGFEETPAAATQTAIPAVEAGEPAASSEPAAAATEEAASVVEALPAEEPAPFGFTREEEAATVESAPVEEAAAEAAPEPVAETAAPEAAEESSVSIEPFVEEPSEVEPAVAPEPAAEATGEPAHVPEPVHAEESFRTAAETGVEPYVEPELPSADFNEEAAEALDEVGVGRVEEFSTAGTFDPAPGQHETEQATLFDSGAEEVTREIEPVAADSSKELTPAAGEWFDFDLGEMGGEAQPAASETAAPEIVFETSAGETLAAPPAAEVEEAEPVAEAQAETTREIEVAAETAEAPPALREPEPTHAAYEPAAEKPEKGLAPFDELSTVPASIQQRIASDNPRERASAIIELSHVDTDEAFQQICAAFDDPSKDVRSAAARALHELRADRAESFTRALREATPERRREIGAAIASSGLAAESISQLTGESRERTYEAFSLLFLMAKAGEVQPLLRAIESHPNNEVRLAVVKLLALSGQKEVLPAFRRLAVRGSLPTEVRSAVMEAIYQISSSQPTPA